MFDRNIQQFKSLVEGGTRDDAPVGGYEPPPNVEQEYVEEDDVPF